MTGNKELALFDFDGTITYSDTLLQFIGYARGGIRLITGFAFLSPVLILNQLKIISSKRAKEIVLSFFFKGVPIIEFQELCDRFGEEYLPRLIRPKAWDAIRELKRKDVRIVIVSASPENWIVKWAALQGLEVIATKLEVNNGIITGRISGENCKGQEKIARIKDYLNLSAFEKIAAYGDSSADKPMLGLATQKFYRPFRN